MKHIIIAGAARSGKTMMALKLGQEGFVHYKMDSIKRGIDNNFWDNYKDNWKKVSPHMAYLIKTIIDENQSDIVKNKEGNHVYQGSDDFYPRIHTMDYRIRLIILSQRNIF